MALRFLRRLRMKSDEDAEQNNGTRNASPSPKNHNKHQIVPYHQRDPITWTSDDVCLWLSAIGLSVYTDTFVENDITGEELLDLHESDFSQLNILKWGHRKKLSSVLNTLRSPPPQPESDTSTSDAPPPSPLLLGSESTDTTSHFAGAAAAAAATAPSNCSSLSSEGSIDNGKSTASRERIVKCVVDDDQIHMIVIQRHESFTGLIDIIQKDVLNHEDVDIVLRYKDGDGDLVMLKNEKDWRNILRHVHGERMPKLYITTSGSSDVRASPSLSKRIPRTSSSSSSSSKKKTSGSLLRTAAILESLTDAAIVINTKGIICFVNGATERLFQYSRDELVGSNVSIIMPTEIAQQHDQILERYIRTGKKKVIGTSRKLDAVRKDGSLVSIWVTVSEHKEADEHGFIGTIHESSPKDTSSWNDTDSDIRHSMKKNNSDSRNNESLMFSVFDDLIEATIVTNHTGSIVFCNKAAESLLGFRRQELCRKSIKRILPPVYVSQDKEIQDYVKTGGEMLSGGTRDLVLQTKSSSLVPVSLSVSKDTRNNGSIHYVAIIRKRTEEDNVKHKSILQQEREVVDNLALPGIIIDEMRCIQGFNKAARSALGFTLMEVLGQNVRMLMPEGEIKKNHDSYVLRYIRTGIPHIIGTTGRKEVTAQAKDGTLVTVFASVTERRLSETKRIFTAILHPKG